MPIKDPVKRKAYQKAYIKKHYRGNKAYYRARNRANDKKVMEFVRKSKEIPCTDCGLSYPYYVMDFDHKRDKKFNLAQARRQGMNIVKQEIAKCDVVCANCHRQRTHGVKDSTRVF